MEAATKPVAPQLSIISLRLVSLLTTPLVQSHSGTAHASGREGEGRVCSPTREPTPMGCPIVKDDTRITFSRAGPRVRGDGVGLFELL